MKIKFSAPERYSLRDLPANLATRYQNALRNDSLGRVEVSLLLFEHYLVNTASGEYRQLTANGEDRAEQIAAAAASLVSRGENREAPAILLLLPPTEFVSARYDMAVSGEKFIRSALQLQAHSLIPAYEGELLMGVNARHSQGTALWYPAGEAEELFRAFKRQDLFLAAIMPRSLALAAGGEEGESVLIEDEDEANLTVLEVRGGAVKALLTVSRRDLEQEPFARQWEQELARLDADRTLRCRALDDWSGLRKKVECLANYCFLPRGSIQASRQIELRKRKKYAGIAAAAAVFLLFIPFIATSLEIGRLEEDVENYRQVASTVLESQAAVFDMEEEWGAMLDFPRQSVSEILTVLDPLVDSSVFTFSVNEGVVDIQGYAPDPAYLVELLAQEELFTNIAQSRSISGSRSSRGDQFGIRMNIRGVNFPAYYQQYAIETR